MGVSHLLRNPESNTQRPIHPLLGSAQRPTAVPWGAGHPRRHDLDRFDDDRPDDDRPGAPRFPPVERPDADRPLADRPLAVREPDAPLRDAELRERLDVLPPAPRALVLRLPELRLPELRPLVLRRALPLPWWRDACDFPCARCSAVSRPISLLKLLWPPLASVSW